MKGTADFSACGTFRWWLQRRWADGPLVCFVMLNPSRASADRSDNTVTRCINYARAWGFGAMSVRNLYPFITPYPKALKIAMRSIDVTGGDRGVSELRAAMTADLVVAAWGGHATTFAAQRFVELTDPKPLWCLGLTRDGKPVHPLMLPKNLVPTAFCRCDGVIWQDALRVAA